MDVGSVAEALCNMELEGSTQVRRGDIVFVIERCRRWNTYVMLVKTSIVHVMYDENSPDAWWWVVV